MPLRKCAFLKQGITCDKW